MSTPELTLWSRTNALGEAVLLADSAKQNLIECDRCPCGALVWDIEIGAGGVYEIYVVLTGAPNAVGVIDWGDQSATRTGLPGTTLTTAPYVTTPVYTCIHTYESAGRYTITLTGSVYSFGHAEEYREFPVYVWTLDLDSFYGTATTAAPQLTCGFYRCTNITEIDEGCKFGNGFRNGIVMFQSCTSLTAVPVLVFPPEVTGAFGTHSMFYHCPELPTVPGIVFPKNITGENASFTCGSMFYGCAKLTTVYDLVFPETVTGECGCIQMFRDCPLLTTVADSVTGNPLEIVFPTEVLGGFDVTYMFYGCTALASHLIITFPESVGSFTADNMFLVSGITTIYLRHLSLEATEGGVSYYSMFAGCASLTDIIVPDTENQQLYYPGNIDGDLKFGRMFYNCTKLDNIPMFIPVERSFEGEGAAGVVTGDIDALNMFYGCSVQDFPDFIFPETARSISCYGMYAASSNTKTVGSVVFPKTLTGTGDYGYCGGQSMLIAANIETVEALIFPETVGGWFHIAPLCGPGIKQIKYFSLPKTVGGFFNAYSAFESSALERITSLIPEEEEEGGNIPPNTLIFPTEIGGYFEIGRSFKLCTALKTIEITFPTEVGGYFNAREMFMSSGLVSVPKLHFPASIEGYFKASNMFDGCISLESVYECVLPVTTGTAASSYYEMVECFRECTSLKVVTNKDAIYASENPEEDLGVELVFPSTVYGYFSAVNMFAECTSIVHLKTLILPVSVLGGGCSFAGMFALCTSLESVPNFQITLNVPNTVSGTCSCVSMFGKCTALTSVGITEFGSNTGLDFNCTRMFAECDMLTSLGNIIFFGNIGRDFICDYMFYLCGLGVSAMPGEIEGVSFGITPGRDIRAYMMFSGSQKIVSINKISFSAEIDGVPIETTAPRNVDLTYFMSGCSDLANIGALDFPTETGGYFNCSYMFAGLLPPIDQSGLSTGNLTQLPELVFPGYVGGYFNATRMFAHSLKAEKTVAPDDPNYSYGAFDISTLKDLEFPEIISGDFIYDEMFYGGVFYILGISSIGTFRYLSDTILLPSLVGTTYYWDTLVTSWRILRKTGEPTEYYLKQSAWLPHGYNPPFWQILRTDGVTLGGQNFYIGTDNCCSAPLWYYDGNVSIINGQSVRVRQYRC